MDAAAGRVDGGLCLTHVGKSLWWRAEGRWILERSGCVEKLFEFERGPHRGRYVYTLHSKRLPALYCEQVGCSLFL